MELKTLGFRLDLMNVLDFYSPQSRTWAHLPRLEFAEGCW